MEDTSKFNFKVSQFSPMTDSQWANISEIVEVPYRRGRPCMKNLRNIVDGLLKIVRTGVQWRNADSSYGAWKTLYNYFSRWKKDGTWGKILTQLTEKARVSKGIDAIPTFAAIDSQSVKVAGLISLDTGIDGNKRINGRKRTCAVDSYGFPLVISVCAANIHDGIAGIELLPSLNKCYPSVKKIYADGTYKEQFKESATWCGVEVEISQKPEINGGFVPQANRWQVERTFGWLNFYRRLSKDYEKTVESSIAFIQLAFIAIILNNI
jgi:transposase